jgi:hypothetical protein
MVRGLIDLGLVLSDNDARWMYIERIYLCAGSWLGHFGFAKLSPRAHRFRARKRLRVRFHGAAADCLRGVHDIGSIIFCAVVIKVLLYRTL